MCWEQGVSACVGKYCSFWRAEPSGTFLVQDECSPCTKHQGIPGVGIPGWEHRSKGSLVLLIDLQDV